MTTHFRSNLVLVCVLLGMCGCVQSTPPALEQATVVAVRPVEMAAGNTGAGALVGADAAAEGALPDKAGLEYTIRLANGQMMTIVQHREATDAVLQPGDPAVVRTIGRYQRVLPVAGTSGPAASLGQ